jgi:hypothetical protein
MGWGGLRVAPIVLQPGANRKDSRRVDWAISYLPALRLAQQWPPSQQAEPDEQQEAPPFLDALPSDFWADF